MPEQSSEGEIKRVRRTPAKRAAKKLDITAQEETPFTPSIDPAAPVPAGFWATQFSLGIRESDILIFLRQLILLVEAGTPLLKSLHTLAARSERPALRGLVSDMAQFVEMGNPLWQAFARHRRYFDTVFVNLVKASEASGTLLTVLKRLTEYRERRVRFARRVQSAMIYPIIVLVACAAVVLLVGKVVLPTLTTNVFDKLGAQVPAFTSGFISTVAFLTNSWVILLGFLLLAGLIALYYYWVRNPLNRLHMDHLKLRLPYVGPNIVRKNAVVEMTRSLGLLLRSGLSMMTCLELTRSAIRNRAVARVLQDVLDSVERGEGFERPLRAVPHIVPPVVTDMLVTGEETGQIDSIAEHIAEAYEEEVNVHVNTLAELVPPVIAVVMGGFVLVLVLAVFLPLISMINQLSAGAGMPM